MVGSAYNLGKMKRRSRLRPGTTSPNSAEACDDVAKASGSVPLDMNKSPEYFNSDDRPVIAADIFAREDPDDEEEDEDEEDEEEVEDNDEDEEEEDEGYSE